MNSQEEKNRATRSHPLGNLESPFLEEDLFVGKSEGEWEARAAALAAESPFQNAFEQGRPSLIEPEELEDEFVEEDQWSDMDESPANEAEAHNEKALAVLEDSIDELYDEDEATYTEGEASSEDATSLEEELLIPEEALVEPEEEEDAYHLEEALDGEFFSEPEEEIEHREQELDASQGKTIYLPIQLNKTVLPKVGVFIPSSFQPSAAIDLIVYFHGQIGRDCKTYPSEFDKKGIEYYWNTPLFKCLREDLVASGKKAILIAPTFMPKLGRPRGPSSDYGDLDKAGKFDFLVNETLTQLKKNGALPADAQVGNIILSGHSGGGLPMQAILDAKNSLNTNVTECWGFECLYFGTSAWEKWLKANQNKYFHHFRRRSFKPDETNTLKKYPNFKDVADGTDHCRIVQEKWRQAIDSSPVFQGGGKSPISSTTSGPMSGLFSLLAGLPGLATLPLTFMTALMEGFQDENHLTNLIFFARYPGLGGRKLKASDPQSLKDEWVGILKTIVRPAIRRMKEAATQSSAGSTPAKSQPSPATPILDSPADEKFSLREWKLAAGKIVVARAGDEKKGPAVAITEAPAVFLPEIIGMARDLAIKNKKNTLADKLDPATWFKKFTRITFLGRPLKDLFRAYWEKIPGKDSENLIKFLRQNFNVNWVRSENIQKSNDRKTINISDGHNSLSLELDDEKTKVNLKFDDGRTDEFIANTMNGKLNIYKGQDLHLEMAKLLKAIESEMVKKYGGDAKSVGDLLLNKSDEGIAGSRKISATAKFSMHMFGLAVDVNYLGNPFIQKRAIPALNTVLKNTALLMNKPTLVYKHGQGFDSVQHLDTMLEKYFSLLGAPTELERLVQDSSSSEWRGLSGADAKTKIQKNLDNLAGLLERGKHKDYFKKHAILDFDKRFVVQMEELGLSWGGHYGDMMHFDMRTSGVGFYIEKARLAYIKKVNDLALRLFKEKKYGTHPPA